MGSSHEQEQKQTELRCLQLAIEARKYQKGESRRILDLLAGEFVCRSCEERPDFVRRLASQKNGTDGILLGIEHFRVDHLAIRKRPKKGDNPANAKIASITPVLEKKKQEIFQKWNLLIDENGLLPEEYLESAAQDIFGLAGDYMQGTVNTNYRSLLRPSCGPSGGGPGPAGTASFRHCDDGQLRERHPRPRGNLGLHQRPAPPAGHRP